MFIAALLKSMFVRIVLRDFKVDFQKEKAEARKQKRIEDLLEKKRQEILAAAALNATSRSSSSQRRQRRQSVFPGPQAMEMARSADVEESRGSGDADSGGVSLGKNPLVKMSAKRTLTTLRGDAETNKERGWLQWVLWLLVLPVVVVLGVVIGGVVMIVVAIVMALYYHFIEDFCDCSKQIAYIKLDTNTTMGPGRRYKIYGGTISGDGDAPSAETDVDKDGGDGEHSQTTGDHVLQLSNLSHSNPMHSGSTTRARDVEPAAARALVGGEKLWDVEENKNLFWRFRPDKTAKDIA